MKGAGFPRRAGLLVTALLLQSLAPAVAADAAPPVERLLHAGRGGKATLADPSSIEPFLDGYAAAAMADLYPPGMMVAVATKDAVFVKAYGSADVETGERATTATMFRIASVSKTFIWTAVMMLEDEGKIDLDADVNGYLKTLKVKAKFGKPVTMNDLMAHRAGFEDSLGVFFQGSSGGSLEEGLVRTRPARVAPPGERTSYSNWGADLAALVVADISGVPYDDFVRTRILEPLGMASTAQHDPGDIAEIPLNEAALDARIATGHRVVAGAPATLRHDSIDPLYPAGAISLDAHDAARWLQFFLNDGVAKDGAGGDRRLLSPQAFTMMRLRAFRDRTGAPDFAHGFMETEIAGRRTFGHGGTLSGFVSDMTIAPTLGLGVFVVVNGAESPRLPDLVSRAVIEQFAGEYAYPSPWPTKADDKMKAAARAVAGVYVGNRRVRTRFEKIASAGADLVVDAMEDGSLAVSSGGATKRFYPLTEDLWTDRSRDRLYVYWGADGSVKRIATSMGTDTAEPVGFLHSSNGLYAALGLVGAFSLLAFLAAWRRQGREVATTPTGRWLALGAAGAALLWLSFIAILIFATVDLSERPLPDLQSAGWPPPSLLATQIAAHFAFFAALGAAIGVPPVFRRSGWSLWRKGHYLLFALAGLIAAYELWSWRLVFSATSA